MALPHAERLLKLAVRRWRRCLRTALFAVGCALAAPGAADKPVFHVYLAGPEVFLPDASGAGQTKKEAIERLNESGAWDFRLVALYPLDNDIPDFAPNRDTGIRIYQANLAMMHKADVVAANMVRFRGPGMDGGTAFEMGYMRGLGKPVFGYYDAAPFYGKAEAAGLYAEKVSLHHGLNPDQPGVDIHGLAVENFGMTDNLMMVGALADTDTDVQPSFQEALLRIAEFLSEHAPAEN